MSMLYKLLIKGRQKCIFFHSHEFGLPHSSLLLTPSPGHDFCLLPTPRVEGRRLSPHQPPFQRSVPPSSAGRHLLLALYRSVLRQEQGPPVAQVDLPTSKVHVVSVN